jgi:hypothetical protein
MSKSGTVAVLMLWAWMAGLFYAGTLGFGWFIGYLAALALGYVSFCVYEAFK